MGSFFLVLRFFAQACPSEININIKDQTFPDKKISIKPVVFRPFHRSQTIALYVNYIVY